MIRRTTNNYIRLVERQLLAKGNGKLTNIRAKRNSYSKSSFSGKALISLESQTKDNFPTKISSEHHDSNISVEKRDISV